MGGRCISQSLVHSDTMGHEFFGAAQLESFRFRDTDSAAADPEKDRTERFREDAREFLRLHGIVREEEGQTIANVDAIMNISSNFLNVGEKGYRYFGKGTRSVPPEKRKEMSSAIRKLQKEYGDLYHEDAATFLLSALHGVSAVSLEEWNSWKRDGREGEPPKPKPIFYEPADSEAAFDADAIKARGVAQECFGVFSWDVAGGMLVYSSEGGCIGRIDSDGDFDFDEAPDLRTALGWKIATDGGRGGLEKEFDLTAAAQNILATIRSHGTSNEAFFGPYFGVLGSILVAGHTSRFGDGHCGAAIPLWRVATRELGMPHEGYSFEY